MDGDTIAAERRQVLRRRWAYLLLLTAPAMFAGNQVTARALEGSIPANALAFWRWAIAALIMVLLTWRDLWDGRKALAEEWPVLAILGFLGVVVCGPPVYLAGATTSATNIALIYAMSPILIVLASTVGFRERMTVKRALGIALAVVGVLVVVFKGDPGVLTRLAFVPGDLWVAFAVLGWSIYVLILQHRPSRLGAAPRFTAICGLGVLALLPFYVWEAATGPTIAFDTRSIGAVLFLALVPAVGAYQAYGHAQRVLGPGPTSLSMYLGPIYVAVIAYLTIGEPIRAYHWLGGALILTGLWRAVGTPSRR
ncbi:MAG: DMT family transporter [Alphaproteobacteria bacterium]|nr:DMT family transporter [Alphaproteobacteria bacterium]